MILHFAKHVPDNVVTDQGIHTRGNLKSSGRLMNRVSTEPVFTIFPRIETSLTQSSVDSVALSELNDCEKAFDSLSLMEDEKFMRK
jgi:hypothetical protein